jgi:hypothetical protein
MTRERRAGQRFWIAWLQNELANSLCLNGANAWEKNEVSPTGVAPVNMPQVLHVMR